LDIFEKLQPLTSQIRRKLFNSIKYTFPVTLKEPIQYFLNTPGKYIRPLFTLLSAQTVNGNIEKVIPAAVGIELFHDFTLIHDDIMDNDDLRRGCLTIHKKWDQGTAILVGDALVGMAYDSMLECESKYIPAMSKLFSQALIRVCEGQALDKEYENRHDVSLDEYLQMISKKTAWLLKLSCQVGGILGNGKQNQIQLLADFGHNLGIGFQIQDDLLDFMADEKILGKHVGSDYHMNKKTYISLKYQEVINKRTATFSNYPQEITEFDSLENLKKALIELNIVDETQNIIDLYFSHALKSLSKITSKNQENLINELVDFLRIRQY
jgi:geranylgeranyl diphosphate synthase type II